MKTSVRVRENVIVSEKVPGTEVLRYANTLEHLKTGCEKRTFENIWSGYGRETSKVDGTYIYEGDFQNGVYHGKGKEYYFDNEDCNTLFVDADVDEEENDTCPPPLRYEGSFKDGNRHGHGVLYDEDGSVLYEGEFYQGSMVNPEAKKMSAQEEFDCRVFDFLQSKGLINVVDKTKNRKSNETEAAV